MVSSDLTFVLSSVDYEGEWQIKMAKKYVNPLKKNLHKFWGWRFPHFHEQVLSLCYMNTESHFWSVFLCTDGEGERRGRGLETRLHEYKQGLEQCATGPRWVSNQQRTTASWEWTCSAECQHMGARTKVSIYHISAAYLMSDTSVTCLSLVCLTCLLHVCHMSVTCLLQAGHMSVIHLLHICHTSHVCHMFLTRLSHVCHASHMSVMCLTRLSHICHMSHCLASCTSNFCDKVKFMTILWYKRCGFLFTCCTLHWHSRRADNKSVTVPLMPLDHCLNVSLSEVSPQSLMWYVAVWDYKDRVVTISYLFSLQTSEWEARQ